VTGRGGLGPVVAIVAAFESADNVAATVTALWVLPTVDEVVVVDDGSSDATAARAAAAGARVVRLAVNRGKGAALTAGLEATPGAGVCLLVDADTGSSAAGAGPLLDAVLGGGADLAVGVLPSAGSRGGFGAVKGLARWGIRRAGGPDLAAPLSGQRAVRADVLRRCLPLAERFGVETAMSVDAARVGARVVEVDVVMDHRHTGRRWAGFRHRAGQGVDITRALWPRLTRPGHRMALVAAVLVAVLALGLWNGAHRVPHGQPLARVDHVVVVALPGLSWADLQRQPDLRQGAVAMANVDTPGSGRPSLAAQWSSASAGAKVAGPTGRPLARDPARPFLVTGMAAARRGAKGHHSSSRPGALGDALHAAGRLVAVVSGGAPEPPAALLAADGNGAVDAGATTSLGGPDLAARAALRLAASGASLVVVDPVDGSATDAARLLAALRAADLPSTLVLVVSPAVGQWHLQPFTISGPGVDGRRVVPVSPSTRRAGLVTMADVAPTVLAALGVPVPPSMTGHPVTIAGGSADLADYGRTDRDASLRRRLFRPATYLYCGISAFVVIVGVALWGRFGFPARRGAVVAALLTFSAGWPVAEFLSGLVPRLSALGAWAVAVYAAIDLVIVGIARRARRDVLAPLGVVMGLTVAVMCGDLLTGGRLQIDTPLGAALSTTARFTGIGNAPFAVLAAATLLAGAAHLVHAPRRGEALFATAALFLLVVVVDAAPTLGDDVGGLLTLVPVFGLTLWALSGRRLRLRTLLAAGVAMVAALAAATAADLARPPSVRTHLGRFASDLLHGSSSAGDLVARRWAANVATYVDPFQYVIVAISFVILAGLALGWWTWLLPRRSPERTGVAAAVAAGLVGNLLNDSGSVVTALVYPYVAPFLVLLAMDRQRAGAVQPERSDDGRPAAEPTASAAAVT
jgi:hypothetical protein